MLAEEKIIEKIKKKGLFTIDYGYTASEFYNARRSTGTLLSYYKHSINDDPCQHIGEDITTHANLNRMPIA